MSGVLMYFCLTLIGFAVILIIIPVVVTKLTAEEG